MYPEANSGEAAHLLRPDCAPTDKNCAPMDMNCAPTDKNWEHKI